MIAGINLPTTVPANGGDVVIREALIDELDVVIRLLTDDDISASRGDFSAGDGKAMTEHAFRVIAADPDNVVLVAEVEGELVGTMQLTVIPGLSRGGATRLQVEAVHVGRGWQKRGIGSAMIRWATDVAAPEAGASYVQLTSDARRTDAHRFYRRLGFADSHVGFKFAVNRQSKRQSGDYE